MGRINKQSTEDFEVSETTQCNTVIMDPCLDTFAQTHRMQNAKTEP